MRILIDSTSFLRKTDGIGRYSVGLITAAAELRPDWEFILVCFIDDIFYSGPKENVAHFKKIYIPFPRRLYQLLYRKGIRLPVDICLPQFTVFLGLNFTLFPHISNGKQMVFIHDLVYLDIPEVVEKKNLAYLQRAVPASLKKADAIVAVSHFTKRRLQAVFGTNHPYLVVENAVDNSFDNIEPVDRNDTILCLGTIEPRKNLTGLIRAYDLLNDDFQAKHTLVIVGRPGWGDMEIDDLKESTKRNLLFTGYVDDTVLTTYFKEAGLFVFPSLYEGFGLPLLEAMLSKTPTIASSIEPFHDIAKNTIRYFDPEHPQDIADLIKDHFSSTHTEGIANAYNIAKSYTWQKSATTLLSAIEDLTQDK